MAGSMKVVSISLTVEQIAFLDEMKAVSGLSKSEVIRQCLDRAEPDLVGALEAMKKYGFRPATKGERMKELRKKTK